MGRQIVKSQTPKFTFKVCLLLFFTLLHLMHTHIHTCPHTSTQPTLMVDSVIFQKGDKGRGAFFLLWEFMCYHYLT